MAWRCNIDYVVARSNPRLGGVIRRDLRTKQYLPVPGQLLCQIWTGRDQVRLLLCSPPLTPTSELPVHSRGPFRDVVEEVGLVASTAVKAARCWSTLQSPVVCAAATLDKPASAADMREQHTRRTSKKVSSADAKESVGL